MNDYRGRFAPTPSGPLHLGSLFGAVISYLDAKAHQGVWLVRIEDIDPPREQAGAAAGILTTLERHGLHWDEQETYQSHNHALYQHRLDELFANQQAFWCRCSRKQLAGQATYPGTCRHQHLEIANAAVRFQVPKRTENFVDIFQGPQSAQLDKAFGDVVVKRRDGLFAYQLAVVCDDIAQGITHVIRGIDILTSTFWQQALYRSFNATHVQYGHFAVLHGAGSAQKLSKQNLAPAVDDAAAIANLQLVFSLLGLKIEADQPATMLAQATTLWQREALTNQQILELPNH